MSNPSPLRKLPHTVVHDTAKLHVINPLETPSGVVQREFPPSDVQAFCSLVARILLRCLRERNEKVLQTLGLSKEKQEEEAPDETDLFSKQRTKQPRRRDRS